MSMNASRDPFIINHEINKLADALYNSTNFILSARTSNQRDRSQLSFFHVECDVQMYRSRSIRA